MTFQLYGPGGQRELPTITRNKKMHDPALYRPSQALSDAVNVALALGQPLLVTGEPGTGKTQLAHHIAHHFQLDKPLIFNSQTTSTATDLFYKYDALGHFHYNQVHKDATLNLEEIEEKFIKYQALGEAIRSKSRKVVLIDEIDKAPRDLPNDTLAAIEQLRFTVTEINQTFTIDPEFRPIIIITSNSEKNLPDAFLRRVVYYHIPFPTPSDLLRILHSKVDGFESEAQLDSIIQHFNDLRDNRSLKLKKRPATAELIQWSNLLLQLKFDVQQLANVTQLPREQKQQLLMSYSVLAKTKEDLAALRKMLRL